MENRIEKAKNNHRSGYNCSQAVTCKELKGIETGTVLRDCQGCVEDAANLLEITAFQTNII